VGRPPPRGTSHHPHSPDGVDALLVRLLVEGATDYAFLVLDVDGRITFWSMGAENIFGYTEQEAVGEHVGLLFTPEDQAGGEPEKELARARETGRSADRRWLQRKDGTRLFGDGVLTALRNAAGALLGFGKVLRDATERRQAEEEVRFLTAHARCLLWHGTVTEQPGRWPLFDTRAIDEAAAQVFCPLQLDPGEAYTHAWWRHRLPEDQRYTDRVAVEQILDGDSGYNAEFRCRDATGAVRWFSEEVYVEPVGPGQWRAVGVVQEITDRKATETALRQQADLLELSQDAILVHDENDRITFWNRAAQETYGWSREEAIGTVAHDLLRSRFPVSLEAVREALEQEGHWEGEIVHTCKDSGEVVVSSRWAVRRSEGALPYAVLEVNRDITAQKRAEAERDALLTQQSRIAETLQRSLLITPPEAAYPGLDVEPLYFPASDEADVGGDFYDTFRISENQVALVAGDVTGKGLDAASFTATVKFALRAFLRGDYPGPAHALERLNAYLIESQRLDTPRDVSGEHLSQSYVSLALAVVDTMTGEAICAAAGGEPPLIVREEGEAEETPARGTLLGAFSRAEFEEAVVCLGPHDLLILATDGVTEARDLSTSEGPIFFGLAGVAHAAGRKTGDGRATRVTLKTVGNAIVEAARKFGGGELADDACLLLARRR
jgi:PAS domain S-box-containing protein